MKSIVKVLSTPFRSSKNKNSEKSQSSKSENKNNFSESLQKGVDFSSGAGKIEAKFNQIYKEMEKMVDQLGTALHFKQKMTDQQKRELIHQLSSMAMNDHKFGCQMMDEDVLSADSDQENDSKKPVFKQDKSPDVPRFQSFKQDQQEAPTRSSEKNSPKSPASPEKEIQDLFKQFQKNQQQSEMPEGKSKSEKQSLSTYGEIKAKMSGFFAKNSLKIFKLMKSKKQENQQKPKSLSQSDKGISQLSPMQKIEKKSKSLIGNILPWSSKKQKDSKYVSIDSNSVSFEIKGKNKL